MGLPCYVLEISPTVLLATTIDPETPIPDLDKQVERGVVGSPNCGMQTYLRSPRMAKSASGGCCMSNGAYPTVLEVDVKTLLKYRNVFHDPEGLFLPGEYRKTFVVFGGIPAQAIVGFKIYDD